MEKKKIKWAVVLVFSAVVFAVALIFLIIHLLPERPENTDIPSSLPTSQAEELPDNPINFDELKAQNPDICAWIQIPGVNVNYAVLQSSDDAEDFYLNHDTQKKYKTAGSIYIQKINNKDFTDPNTVIYGHNMLNGSMFGTLKKFRNRQFFEENTTIYVYTPGHILTYTIYSAFVYDDRHILNSFNFGTDKGFSAFLEQTLNPTSMVKNIREGVNVTTNDRIISLSTCTANDSERYLVEGVLINDQPTK